MQADRQQRIGGSEARSRHGTQTLLTAIAVLILAAGAWILAPTGDDAPTEPIASKESTDTPVAPRPEPATVIAEAPDIPEAEPEEEPEASMDPVEEPIAEETPPEPEPEPAPPTPEELDAMLRTAIDEAGITAPEPLRASLRAPYLLDRGVSSMDQLARGLVPTRTLNLPRPKGAFPTTRDGQAYRVDPAGYDRYDRLVTAITSLPVDTLADFFHRFREELSAAYATLGYPDDAMDNTLIAALDAIIGAPVREDPPRLRSKGAVWAYEDTALESASDLHKQLLRAGPDNTRALQRWAADLKSALLEP